MDNLTIDGSITLPHLPYREDALAPVISARTLACHYGKHHAGYVATVNRLIAGTPFARLSLDDLVRAASTDSGAVSLYHNAAQVWNHNFYWPSMAAGGGGQPVGALKQAIINSFGSFEQFRESFTKAALGEFGSGWVWLTADHAGDLEITATHDADTPLTGVNKALLTLDLWEHAYYLDVQNRRADYVSGWLDHLVNWRFAEQNLI